MSNTNRPTEIRVCYKIDTNTPLDKPLFNIREKSLNSLEDKSLKSKHVLNVNFGEEGFINDIPFVHHAGRGAARAEDYYETWKTEVSKYLDITI